MNSGIPSGAANHSAGGGEALFVYGTLRKGGEAGGLLAGCVSIADETISGLLFDLGQFPALLIQPGGRVVGEVWMCPVDTLARLDSYEGVAEGLFSRVRAETGWGTVWTYVAGPALRGRLRPERIIPSGDWLRRAGPGSGQP
jgi:gamma-glutamylcyclotransferase (GGCT)/AIG2-like uncharacterized protein YtfP